MGSFSTTCCNHVASSILLEIDLEEEGVKRIKAFLWTIAHSRIMTNENRVHHNIASDPFCHNYRLETETILHILRDCPLVKTVWKSLLSPNNVTPFFSPELLSWLINNLSSQISSGEGWPWATIFGAAVWNIWKWRNRRIFNIDNCPSSNPTVAIKSHVADIMLTGGSGANNLISTKQVSMVGWKYPPELALVVVEC